MDSEDFEYTVSQIIWTYLYAELFMCLFICVSFFGAQQSPIQFGITLAFVNDDRIFIFGELFL